ncbi:unnamed protein product [Linum trigynum]|uniref:Uncharacterized protein n=1 Tax=Linum trigynum TaxID=586398 RepID=A0AAV2DIL3_9ROSI
MSDFGFGNLSDTDDSAVEELISQTRDLCVLEQVSKINCSDFNDSLLPSDLETRFRKLKSFPVSSTRPAASASTGVVPKSLSNSKSELHRRGGRGFDEGFESPSDDPRVNTSDGQVPKIAAAAAANVSSPLNSLADEEGFSEDPGPWKGSKKKQSKLGSVSSPSDSSNSCIEDVIYSQSEERAAVGMTRKSSNSNSKLKSKPFIGSPLGSSNCSRDSPSPPRRPGCFWCSPKKPTSKKSKENWDLGNDGGDELLTDLGIFSEKEQEKILRKAMKEEERINKEAVKIVKWAKQASARRSYHGTEDDDDLSDDNATSK